VDYLRRSGQLADLDFVLSHIDDLPDIYFMSDNEVRVLRARVPLVPDIEPIVAAEAKVA
jgi:hypothetical protein